VDEMSPKKSLFFRKRFSLVTRLDDIKAISTAQTNQFSRAFSVGGCLPRLDRLSKKIHFPRFNVKSRAFLLKIRDNPDYGMNIWFI
jgi:hypothetical protein